MQFFSTIFKITISVFLLVNVISNAFGWNQKIHKSTKKHQHPFTDSFVSTVWGQCYAEDPEYDSMPGKVKNITISSHHFFTQRMSAKIGKVTGANGNEIKAPLIVFIPGAFSNFDSDQARRFMKDFMKLKYHILVMPNPWGVQYATFEPISQVGNIESEALQLYDAIRESYRKLERENAIFKEVRLVGVSYGAFLVNMIGALNAKDKSPIPIKDITCFAPPYHLGKTLKRMDKYLAEGKKYYDNLSLASKLIKLIRICRLKKQREVTASLSNDAKLLTLYGFFHEALVKSLVKHDEIWSTGKIPYRQLGQLSSQYNRWKKELNFRKYFLDYAPKALKTIEGEKGAFNYYRNITKKYASYKVRVLISKNDFINDPGVWNKKDPSVLLLDRGGHYGFRNDDWFQNLLYSVFKRTKSDY